MQPRQQNLFLIVPFLLFSLASCVEQDYVKSVRFTNRLKVDVKVWVTCHIDPLTEDNSESVVVPVPQTIGSGTTHVFEAEREGSGVKPIRKIETEAGGYKETCDVQKLFAVGVVEELKLELVYRPEDESPDPVLPAGLGDDYKGNVFSSNFINKYGKTVNVLFLCWNHPMTTASTSNGIDAHKATSTELQNNAGHHFYAIQDGNRSPIRKLVVEVDNMKAFWDVNKRYGHDNVWEKYLEVYHNQGLKIPEIREQSKDTSGYINRVSIVNYLTENAHIVVTERKAGADSSQTADLEPGKGYVYRMEGDGNKDLYSIQATVGIRTASMKYTDLLGRDKVDQINLKLVYADTIDP